MKNMFLMVSIGLILMGIAFLMIFSNKNNSLNSAATATAKVNLLPAIPAKAVALSKAETENLHWAEMEQAADLKRAPLKREDGKAKVKIAVVIQPTLHPGDADAIEMDLRAQPRAVLVSLEALGGGKSYSWELPSDFISKGRVEKTFEIPVTDKPEQYGILLCTAQSGEKDCHGKPFKDINKIFLEHIRHDRNEGLENRTIFFQFILLDNRGVAGFASSFQGASQFTNLKKYLTERGILKEAELDRSEKLTEVLRSLPLELSAEGISIVLPHLLKGEAK